MEKKKKKKIKYVDDGHTVYDMSGVTGRKKSDKKDDDAKLTRKERRAAIRAALETYLPVLGMVVAAFAIAAILLYFWLM